MNNNITHPKNTLYIHTINPQIAEQIGESESVLLSQIDYWLSKSGKSVDNLDGKWIYNSHKEWLKQFSYWSLSKLRRTIKSLENLGLIISVKVNSKKWNQTKWYTIDYEKYAELFKREYLKSYNSRLSIIEKEQSINKSDCLVDSLVSNTDRFNSSHFKKNIVTKSKNSALRAKKKISKKESKNSKDIKLNIYKNTSQSPKVCICSEWTNQSVQNEQMLIVTKNNYTKKISSYKKFIKKEEHVNNFHKNLEISKKMVDLWNKVFKYSLKPIKAYTNQKNINYLLDILCKYFNNDLDQWRKYALKINSSQFLMGEKETKNNFKATFTWLIKPETIEKIMNDEYGVGDRELDINNISNNVEAQKEEIIKTADKKITEYVKKKIDDEKEQNEFKNYIKKGEYTEDSDKYSIGMYVQNIGSYNLVNNPDNKGILKTIYETYIVKKYFRRSRFKIREQMREIVNEKMKEESILGNFNLLKNLNDSLNFNCIENNNIDFSIQLILRLNTSLAVC